MLASRHVGGMFPMSQPSSRIQEALLITLQKIRSAPDLTPDEEEWLRHYLARLIGEFWALNSEEVITSSQPIAA